jgi:hypothetical protein
MLVREMIGMDKILNLVYACCSRKCDMHTEWKSYLEVCLSSGLSPYLHLNTSEPHSLPTLMPRWNALEASELVRPLDQFVSSSIGQVGCDQGIRSLVILHAFYLDRLKPLLERLIALDCFSLIVVTTDTAEKAERLEAWRHELVFGGSKMIVEVFQNRGRDVLPFWKTLGLYGAGYDLFLKLHMKRSSIWDEQWQHTLADHDGAAGWAWTEDISRCLIPSSTHEYHLLTTWIRDEGIGALFPRPYKGVQHAGWGNYKNLFHASELLRTVGLSDLYLLLPLIFPAGNMFWGNVKPFLPLASVCSNADFYPDEPLADDGTPLHAMERSYAALLVSKGFNVGILFPPKSGDPGSGLMGMAVDFNHPMSSDHPLEESSRCTASSHSQAVWLYLLHLKEVMQERSRGDQFCKELENAHLKAAHARQSRAESFLRRLIRKIKTLLTGAILTRR